MARICRTLAVAAVALLVLTGCSSDDGDKQAAPGATTTVAAGAGATTTIRPVDTSFSGQNSAQFCTLAKTYNDRASNVGAASSPAQLRTATQDGRTAVNQALSAAPAELKPDMQVLANAFGAVFAELEKVNFDATKVSLAAFAPLQTPEFQQATIRFQAYIKNVCGITG